MDASKAADIASVISVSWQIVAGVCVAVFLLIIWCVRLESKVLYLEKDHESVKGEQEKKSANVWAKLDLMQVSMNSILQLLGEMKGRLDARDEK